MREGEGGREGEGEGERERERGRGREGETCGACSFKYREVAPENLGLDPVRQNQDSVPQRHLRDVQFLIACLPVCVLAPARARARAERCAAGCKPDHLGFEST